jgi:hypothetical protein
MGQRGCAKTGNTLGSFDSIGCVPAHGGIFKAVSLRDSL